VEGLGIRGLYTILNTMTCGYVFVYGVYVYVYVYVLCSWRGSLPHPVLVALPAVLAVLHHLVLARGLLLAGQALQLHALYDGRADGIEVFKSPE